LTWRPSAIAAWAILAPAFGIVGIAVGYAIGAAITALSLLVVAWRLNGQRWWGVLLALLASVLAISGLSAWRLNSPANHLVDIAAAAAFAVAALVPSVPLLRRVWAARR